MEKTILFSATATEKRVAVLQDGKVVDFVVERPDEYRILGNIYRGRISSILPGIQSAFIDIGLDKAAFLHVSDVDPSLLLEPGDDRIEQYTDRDNRSKRRKVVRVPIEKILSVGQDILVQVIKESIGNKSPKLTTQISLAGRFLVLVPDSDSIGVSKKTDNLQVRKMVRKLVMQYKPPGVGFIVRTIGLKMSEQELIFEIKDLVDRWRKAQQEALIGHGPKLLYKEHGITTRVIRDLFSGEVRQLFVDTKRDHDEILSYLQAISPDFCKRVVYYTGDMPLFDKFNIEKDLERSLKRKVWVKNGGYLYFDHAEALLAIDVNTGRNIGKKDLEDTIFQTNLAAAHEICRQLRLRDIGGLIVVDFIDMRKSENRKRIEHEMRTLLGKDPTATSCTGLSKFGLMEITRKRVRPELQELFTDVCHACNGLGRVFSPATVTASLDRWLRRAKSSNISPELIMYVSPSIAMYLQSEENRRILQLEKAHGFKLDITIDESLDQDEFEIFRKGDSKPITEDFA